MSARMPIQEAILDRMARAMDAEIERQQPGGPGWDERTAAEQEGFFRVLEAGLRTLAPRDVCLFRTLTAQDLPAMEAAANRLRQEEPAMGQVIVLPCIRSDRRA